MLGWYDHDRQRNNGCTVHLPFVLKAYFETIRIKVCFLCFIFFIVQYLHKIFVYQVECMELSKVKFHQILQYLTVAGTMSAGVTGGPFDIVRGPKLSQGPNIQQ